MTEKSLTTSFVELAEHMGCVAAQMLEDDFDATVTHGQELMGAVRIVWQWHEALAENKE
jgi:metal-sulfur cluster biosynthetic enzyme